MVAHSIDPASDWKPAMERVCRYVYDARGKLTRIDGSEFQHWRFWCGAHVAAALHNCTSGTFRVTWLQVEGPRAEIWDGPGGRKALLASDAGGSVLLEADNVVQSVSYAAFGERAKRPLDSDLAEELAFNGELLDPVSRCYLLGAGHHRPYSTTLGIFLAPDCAAPFRAGGINSLAYCGGDPVNRIDPSGHVWKWILRRCAYGGRGGRHWGNGSCGAHRRCCIHQEHGGRHPFHGGGIRRCGRRIGGPCRAWNRKRQSGRHPGLGRAGVVPDRGRGGRARTAEGHSEGGRAHGRQSHAIR